MPRSYQFNESVLQRSNMSKPNNSEPEEAEIVGRSGPDHLYTYSGLAARADASS
jgi:hypothetical protein